jgi:hypothetical protein
MHWSPVRSVSYALPITYGIYRLQVPRLRGGETAWWLLLSLAGLGLLFFVLNFLPFSREFKRA